MRSRFAILVLSSVALADTVHLKDGGRIHGRVLREEPEVLVNRFNSTFHEMERGVRRVPSTEVLRIDRSLPASHREFQRKLLRASTVQACLSLAIWCEEQGLKKERRLAFEIALRFDSDNEAALKGLGRRRPGRDWRTDLARARSHLRGKPVKIEKGFPYGNLYLLRARRSLEQPRGYVRERSVALRADRIAPGARYALYVPEDSDPLRPTPLVIGLHGGGPGGERGNLVVGEGWQALGLYLEECQRRRWICACPTAVKGDWSARENSKLLDALLDEICALYNVDLNRVYLIGHSMGGAGVWAQALRRPRIWAAVAAASSYDVQGIDRLLRSGTGFYVYHGESDSRTPVVDVLRFVEPLAGSAVDFVYTELPGRGHEFPAQVVSDIFRFFEGRLLANQPGSRKPAIRPASSFERKPSRDEERYLDSGSAGATLRSLFDDLGVGGRKSELAASALALHPDPKVSARAAKVLVGASSEPDVRRCAAQVLGARRAVRHIDELGTVLLLETDESAIMAVLSAMESIADTRSGAFLIRFLEKRRALLQRKASGSRLRCADWESILPPMARACSLIGSYAPKRGAQTIVRTALEGVLANGTTVLFDREIQDPLPAARELARSACGALRYLKDPVARPVLERMAADQPHGVSLRRLEGPVAEMATWTRDPEISGYVREALEALGEG